MVAAFQSGRLSDAEPLARAMAHEFPDSPVGWKVLSAIYGAQEKYLESVRVCQKVLELLPTDAPTYNNLGISMKALGRFSEAETSIREAIRLRPDFSEAYDSLANTLSAIGRFDEAEANHIRSIDLNPGRALAHNNYGVTLSNANKLLEAEKCFEQAIKLDSKYVEAHCNLANTLLGLGRHEAAEQVYQQAVKLKPDCAKAYSGLGNVLRALERLNEAEHNYRRALELNPADLQAKHMLAALSGEKLESASLDYVEQLFDKYAENFEFSLLKQLQYRIPDAIKVMVSQYDKSEKEGVRVLDLGCGSGLLGAELAGLCQRIEGVDISGKMLIKAKEKNLYDRLVKQDIITYLRDEPLDFDFIIATDVFTYLGDLSEVFRYVKSRSARQGHLIFSVEHSDANQLTLQTTGRYAHSKAYIEGLCEQYGFEVAHFETFQLRLQKNDFITGGLYRLVF